MVFIDTLQHKYLTINIIQTLKKIVFPPFLHIKLFKELTMDFKSYLLSLCCLCLLRMYVYINYEFKKRKKRKNPLWRGICYT